MNRKENLPSLIFIKKREIKILIVIGNKPFKNLILRLARYLTLAPFEITSNYTLLLVISLNRLKKFVPHVFDF